MASILIGRTYLTRDLAICTGEPVIRGPPVPDLVQWTANTAASRDRPSRRTSRGVATLYQGWVGIVLLCGSRQDSIDQ